MNNTIKTRSQRRELRIGRAGFTLVELLVVVAILALLLGLLMPAINSAYEKTKIATSKSTINLISAAVEMYRNDFQDHPAGTEEYEEFPPSSSVANVDNGGDWKGAELLVLFLTGYAGDDGSDGEEDPDNMETDDGNNGFGFRIQQRGKVYGPYNGTENIAVTNGPNNAKVFVDSFNNPILYYRWTGSIYDEDDNANVSASTTGDPKQANYLDNIAAKQVTHTFLLLTPGVDKQWGVQDSSGDWNNYPDPESAENSNYPWNEIDDITNFGTN